MWTFFLHDDIIPKENKNNKGGKMKIDKKDVLHIIIIIVGMLFIAIPILHSNLWFDESYSVAICNHTFGEIWSIGSHDVHPVLYYWVLHFINLIFGNNIIIYRIFSWLCASLIGILGFTHIRKDFGKRVGILFSFFSFFLPVITVYVGEVRMYTFAMLLVTIMCIYAYRIYKNEGKKQIKNWLLFAFASLASAYTHYYGLMAAGIVNLILFIYFVKRAWEQKKFTYEIKAFFIVGILQIVLYLPWVISLLSQMKVMSSTHFWIYLKFPDTLVEFFTFQFTGNLEKTKYINNFYAMLFGIILCAYLIYLYIRNRKTKKEEMFPIKLSFEVYIGVILGACLMSVLLKTPIIYARYMLCVTGIFIFMLAYYMAKRGNTYMTIIICILCMIVGTVITINLCRDNYDSSNQEPFAYLRENIEENDILFCSNEGSGFVVSANFPNHFLYFWDDAYWNVEEGYKAFGKHMKTIYNLEEIKDVTGRIWVLDAMGYGLLEKLQTEYNVEVIEQNAYSTRYHGFQYSFALIEK